MVSTQHSSARQLRSAAPSSSKPTRCCAAGSDGCVDCCGRRNSTWSGALLVLRRDASPSRYLAGEAVPSSVAARSQRGEARTTRSSPDSTTSTSRWSHWTPSSLRPGWIASTSSRPTSRGWRRPCSMVRVRLFADSRRPGCWRSSTGTCPSSDAPQRRCSRPFFAAGTRAPCTPAADGNPRSARSRACGTTSSHRTVRARRSRITASHGIDRRKDRGHGRVLGRGHPPPVGPADEDVHRDLAEAAVERCAADLRDNDIGSGMR